MSYQVPQDYPTLPSMAIPHALVGDDIKQFKGARNIIKYLPSASGSSVGPNSSVLFVIPAEPYGYIKPNSMYLRGQISVSGNTGFAGAAAGGGAGVVENSFIAFAGNTFGSALSTTTSHGAGGASSVLNRVTLTLPGGASMSYNQQQHYRNAVTPHTLDAAYYMDMRQMEHAGVTYGPFIAAARADATPPNTPSVLMDRYFSTPMDIPILNADAAFPLLLCSQGLTLEIVTSSLTDSFYYTGGNISANQAAAYAGSLSTYALSGLALVYEVIQVTPEFKNALITSKAGSPYVCHVDDRMVIGPIGVTAGSSPRLNVGVGLSSLKSVLFTEALLGTGLISDPKVYSFNGTTTYNVYRDGQQISIPNITSEDVAFMEMQRSVGRLNDSQTSSIMQLKTTNITSGLRTSYSASSFLGGCSFQCIDDWSFSAKGAPCDQLAIELLKTTPDANKWGVTTASANSNLYIFCMYDAVVVILPDGTCQIRK